MKCKITFILLFLALGFSFGQSIFSNTITGSNPNTNNPYTIGQVIDGNITVSGIGRGTGINGQNGNNRYNARDWNLTTIDVNDFFEFIITPNATFEIDFISFEYTGQRSNTGPINIAVRSSIDGFTSDIGTPTVTGATIDLSAVNYQNISAAITFRVYAWGGSNTNGTFSIDDFTFNGVVNAIPCFGGTTYTWTVGGWDIAGSPTINDPVIIDENYNTTTNGNFSACSLTINSGSTLTMENGGFVEVENDITVGAGAGINVQTEGSLVQNNDNALFTNNSTNGVSLTKTKQMQNNISYTYWSSPVENEVIENTFGTTPANRRYQFIAANFIDIQAEIGNTNTFGPGTDDIDDNGDDWQLMSTGAMTPGVGYATMPSSIVGPGGFPSNQSFIFRGAFNNGTVSVPLISNSAGAYNDWNFIGNPYPSAISVDQFFTINLGLIDVLYLWDQATAPDPNASGNEGMNFSNDDYAIINGTGQIGARGDTGTPPVRYIASGQGFFVEALATGNATFNNSMRVTGNNSQFFRTNSTKAKSKFNKFWMNLTSDNGVSNQILIGYVDGASKNADATYYDAPRNLSTVTSAILYSNIEGSAKKFAIQGKAPSDLTEKEVINLGVKTSINVPTIYTLSIAQLEGEFLNNNPIYIKDNLLNTFHNLKDSDYNFTLEVGEFNNRFEIVFSQDALYVNNVDINKNALSIIEHKNGDVQFKLNAVNKIKNIKIIDLQGRTLYNFNVDIKDEVFKLSNLSRAPYIAKITLDNNYVITKKAIKKY